MFTRTTRIQLWVFAVVTVFAVGTISLLYVRIPARLGLGTYEVSANFVAGGGLYENANVTFRGVQAGRVEAVELTKDGVAAHMRLNSNVKIPENSTAIVKSVSAVGEQYVDFVPPDDPSPAVLKNGATISEERTAIPQDVAELLREADQLVSSLDNTRLADLLRETFDAFNGSGPELARMIQSARVLIDEANASWPETSALIDQAGPFLEAQLRSGDDIRSWADGLARFTSEVAGADPQVRSLLHVAPGAAAEASETFSGIRPSFPVLAANLANFGRVGVIYHKSIEQALVIFPALQASLLTIGGQLPVDEGGKQDFKISINDPPPCNTGFLPPSEIRTPGDTTLRDLPTDLYCKVAQNDPMVVRGARNYPCQEFPGKRAPTIQLCRDPRGYVPIGNSPWRGPPVPIGTPMDVMEDDTPEDGRNILPPNKFPYIPPENDPDPGYPVAPGLVPPGVQTGPGPAPHQPWPYIPPPNQGPPPPPLTAWIPPAPYPNAWPPPAVPPGWATNPPNVFAGPYGAPPPPSPPPPPPAAPNVPQASGARYGTYDQNTGVFVDPAGGTGVFAPGIADVRPQENWVDLMLYPEAV
ncbi:phospholipid/cholesterol/gamma-HCH transport system substrate-binding protein [Mycolicibacterium rutilum]|uniref:Phospholipid/cholesterol/gamma-HCH transport system substrate-binding protein n=1 Tax=Mycolicibacterium rutilum TaxID=370526 RepID=A0A1H6JSK2_MYCRU|nr:MCE family protein [Mycolicibacterium rutilum]SEH62286.1 phospholipid/cholesterol/gamma-HCH transport system substrate-binding protein [Mycolicibacterium rutilum]